MLAGCATLLVFVVIFSSFSQIYFVCINVATGAQFEGDLGEILALGAEISPYIGLREKWESP